MLDGVDLIAVLVIARSIRLHTVHLHLQTGFPFGIEQVRVVDSLILREIACRSNDPGAAASQGRKRGKHRGDDQHQEQEQSDDPPYDGVPFDRLYYLCCNLLRCNGGFLCVLTGLLRLTRSLGILAFQLFFIPQLRKRFLFQLRVIVKQLLCSISSCKVVLLVL